MRKGFTLMELIVVVIIIGILAMIGLPQFFKVAERGRAAEAASILGNVRSAQFRYYAEYSNFTGTCSNLDISFSPPKYFNDPTCVANTSGTLGTMASKAGGYTVGIYFNGTLYCSSGTCPKLD